MKLVLPVKQYQKLRAYVEATDQEISGLGKIRVMRQSLMVENLRIFEQTVTPSHTVLKEDDLAGFYDKLIQDGESLVDWKLWWHSHAQIGTCWSGTDKRTIEDFDNETNNNNWMVSLVTNIAGDILTRLDIFEPLRTTVELDCDISFFDPQITPNAIEEVAEKVNVKKVKQRKKKKHNRFNKKDKDIVLPDEVVPEKQETLAETIDVMDYKEGYKIKER